MKAWVGFLTAAALLALASAGPAATFDGTLYYTNFTGGQNVWRVDFHYNDVTHVASLDPAVNLASTNGADGIIFSGPHTLLVGGQGSGNVYQLNLNATNTAVVGSPLSATVPGGQSYHLALDPSGSKVYTSNFGGPLETLALTPNIHNGTQRSLVGSDTGMTQLAFAPNGRVFYDDGSPNGGGTAGLMGNLNGSGNVTTTRILNGQTSIHGMIYDPFTGLMTFFGAGAVGTLDPNADPTGGTSSAMAASFKQRTGINGDFDQGAVDGNGHAFIAGNGQITFIDYSQTHDITSVLNTVIIFNGFGGIDDLAPLVGAGSQTGVAPVPPAAALLATGCLTLFGYGWRRRKAAVPA